MFSLFFITVPYGRHTQSRNWGPLVDNRVGWIIMELPALLTMPIVFLMGDAEKTTFLWLMFAAWIFHYFNRVVIFPFRTKTTGKKMPLSVALFGVIFNVTNGVFLGYYLVFLSEGQFRDEYFLDPRFFIGLFIFASGIWINWRSDRILFNLRKPGETGYKIPFGGWYRWISCPNYFGEIVEWAGFAPASFIPSIL